MSTDSTTDEFDDLPAIIGEDTTSTGAAADSSDLEGKLKGLPRLLRYAMLADDADAHIAQRLAAEIDEFCPQLALNAEWLASRETDTGSALCHRARPARRRRGQARIAQSRRLRPPAVPAGAARCRAFCGLSAGHKKPAARLPQRCAQE